MKAPEKIYVDNPNHDFWYRTKGKNSIEYTRTDAFIEKAENYLKNQFIKDVSVLAGGAVSISFNTAISNFINYMKDGSR